MTVSVVLVAYHGDPWLRPCLASLAQASRQELHLVLVDNGGTSAVDALDLSPFRYEKLSTSEPLGFAAANNFALVNASHLEDVVLFLNQDTISEPGWIDVCLEVFESDSRVGAVSPLMRTYDDVGWDHAGRDCLESCAGPLFDSDSRGIERFVETLRAPAAALLVTTEVLRATGPFDPIFGSYYEDYDLCRRIRATGRSVGFCTRARIRHYSGSSTTTKQRMLLRTRQDIRNRVIQQLRASENGRARVLFRQLTGTLPRRIARRVLLRPKAQPLRATLGAFWDLLLLSPRLVSRRRDEAAWASYLDALGWTERPRRTHPASGTATGGAKNP